MAEIKVNDGSKEALFHSIQVNLMARLSDVLQRHLHSEIARLIGKIFRRSSIAAQHH